MDCSKNGVKKQNLNSKVLQKPQKFYQKQNSQNQSAQKT